MKQVIVVPAYLGMSPGKVASQCCWAAMLLSSTLVSKRVICKVDTVEDLTDMLKKGYANKFIKVHVVIDEGLTEVPPGSVTAVSFSGFEDDLDRLTRHLKLL